MSRFDAMSAWFDRFDLTTVERAALALFALCSSDPGDGHAMTCLGTEAIANVLGVPERRASAAVDRLLDLGAIVVVEFVTPPIDALKVRRFELVGFDARWLA